MDVVFTGVIHISVTNLWSAPFLSKKLSDLAKNEQIFFPTPKNIQQKNFEFSIFFVKKTGSSPQSWSGPYKVGPFPRSV